MLPTSERHLRSWKPRAAALVLAVTLSLAARVGRAQGIPVIDVANLAQNLISAIEEVIAVAQRITQIAYLVKQLDNMILHTQNYSPGVWDEQALPLLQQLGDAINQEQAIAYSMSNLDGVFRRKYPGYVPPQDFHTQYDMWTRTTLDTVRGVLESTQLQANDFVNEQSRLQALQSLSDSSVGRMQVLQAGNMIAAEQVQQVSKLRQLVMAQANAQAVYMANETNKEAQEQAQVRDWLTNATDKPVGDGVTGFGGQAAGQLPTLR